MSTITQTNQRTFLPAHFIVTDWNTLQPFYDQVLHQSIANKADLEAWLLKINELDSVVKEDLAWRYIKMTCNTADKELADRYNYFMEEISPKLSEYGNLLNRKYYDCPFRQELSDAAIQILDQLVANEIELFRAENVSLHSESAVKCQEYAGIIGAMTIELDGETLTVQQASARLQSPDRSLREKVWQKISERRLQDENSLDNLFDELRTIRNQIARNAGFDSYTDYRFKELARFDYTKENCQAFHNAVEKVVKPLYEKLSATRKEKLGLAELRPWDTRVDIWGDQPLRPFTDGDDLLQKTIQLYHRLSPEIGKMIETMNRMGHFDLTSRVGKAPGGYNYPLHESGVPFIFMNAVGTQSDLKTMVHECGHAIHSFLNKDLPLNVYKDVPSEVAELASMSMELISMDYWDTFYSNSDDLRRAKLNQLTGTITILPWIAAVDAFQNWIYDHPNHSIPERREVWNQIYDRFHGEELNWSGYENVKKASWQMQLHIYEVPFYYIEYGIAQLGALQVWKNYKQDAQKGLAQYLKGLSVGYTMPIPDVYATAGIAFDFSEAMMRDLFNFVEQEYNQLIQ